MTSIIEHVLDEGFKCSSIQYQGRHWDWFESPDNKLRLARFGAAMAGLSNMRRWLADVAIATHYPHLRIVVQDREAVVADAVEYWKKNMPDALESGRVKFQAQDFFKPQAAQEEDVTVFFLCKIIHDWSDEYCLTILKHLRAAAGLKTQLVIDDQIIACVCDEPAVHEIPGAEIPVPPKPLLLNMGRASSMAYNTDVMMMGFFNGQERTITYLRDLLSKAGWKLAAVHHDVPSAMRHQKAIAVPN
ncbi:S-adenosyl-L-methionine-dependent methyltransferase [Russula compacta]|nr:S-adenosyl-L-methionine-dependent methyltransferase [Russula compacta]